MSTFCSHTISSTHQALLHRLEVACLKLCIFFFRPLDDLSYELRKINEVVEIGILGPTYVPTINVGPLHEIM